MNEKRLSISNLTKSYSVPVLKSVSLTVEPGEIRALVGENGAGKSTLANILSGNVSRDGGDIRLDGVNYRPRSPADGIAARVSCAAQELRIIDTLSVAENIALSNLQKFGAVIVKKSLRRNAERLLQRVGLESVSPDTLAGELTLADRQLVEFAKAIHCDCRVLILDEPTSALSPNQAETLHQVVAEIASVGTSVIYISHRLDDVLKFSDTVTILRDGKIVATSPAPDLTVAAMVEQMSGNPGEIKARKSIPEHRGDEVLQAREITTSSLPYPLSFSCDRGEIVGVAGLAGCGKSDLLQTLFGLHPLTSGQVRVSSTNGRVAISSPSQAVKCGVGFIGAERQSMGLFAGQSVLSNMTLAGLTRLSTAMGVLNPGDEVTVGQRLIKKLDIRCNSLTQDIDELSGGNQQKTLLARWIIGDADVLLLSEPTRGVDVATKYAIYDLLFDMQGRGKTLVVASSELDELMTISDRILVLSNRKIVRAFSRGDWSEKRILEAAFQEFVSAKSNHDDARQRHERPPEVF